MSTERLLVLAVFVADVALVASLFVVAAVVYAKLTRLALVRGVVGFGPVVGRARLFGVPLVLRLVPLTSYVVPYPVLYPPDGDDDLAPVAARVAAGEIRGYDASALWVRLGFVSLAVLVAAVVAIAALGPATAMAAAGADIRRLALGVLGPLSSAREALDHARDALHVGGPWYLARRLTGTLLAAQALMIWPNLQFLAPKRSEASAKVALVFFLAGFGVGGVWLLAAGNWLLRG